MAQARLAAALAPAQCVATCQSSAPRQTQRPSAAGGTLPVGNDWSLNKTISGVRPITGLSAIQQRWKHLDAIKPIGTPGDDSKPPEKPNRLDFKELPKTCAGGSDRVPPGSRPTAVAGSPQEPDERAVAIARSGMVREHAEKISRHAREQNEIFIFQSVNPAATGYIGHVAAKPLEIEVKSAKDGPAAGFIPENPRHLTGMTPSEKAIYMGKIQQYLALGYKLTRIADARVPGEFIEVLADRDGKAIVSDYDLLAIGRRAGTNKSGLSDPINHSELGRLSIKDMNTRNNINRVLGSTVIQHGALNTAPPEKADDIKFPVTAYDPDGTVRSIGGLRDLKAYFKQAAARGFDLPPNRHWGWKSDGCGGWL